MAIYKFRDCLFNTMERRAIRDGKNLKLTPKALDLLELLIIRRGGVVSKDEILGHVWNGSFVEEGNLAVHASALRRSLGENETRTFIETVQGVGYRFVAPTELITEEEWRKATFNSAVLLPKKRSPLLFDSIAVLPLHNQNNEPEIDYLADGLTESLINSLSHIGGLRVLARNTVFRYKNKNIDPQKVGETLGVPAVLSGRLRIVKERMMVSVELTNVAAGSQTWGTRFHEPFTEIIEIQEKIVSGVSQKLVREISQVTRNSVKELHTDDNEAYRLYLKGKFFLEKRTIPDAFKAIEYFKQSISRDPDNPYPYIEICEGYLLLNVYDAISFKETRRSMAPFLSVLEQQGHSSDVFYAMTGHKSILSWEWEKAERQLEKSIAINPNCLAARYRYLDVLVFTGRTAEALEAIKYLPELDPRSTVTLKRMGKVLCKLRRFESAIWHITEAMEMEPANSMTYLILGWIFIASGRYSEAIAVLERSYGLDGPVEALFMIAYTHACMGQHSEAHQMLEKALFEDPSVSNYLTGVVYGALGEFDKAFDLMNAGLENHEIDLGALKADPRADPLKIDPRFKDLLAKVGFPSGGI